MTERNAMSFSAIGAQGSSTSAAYALLSDKVVGSQLERYNLQCPLFPLKVS